MTPEEYARLSPEEIKNLSRGFSTEMSPAAIEKRIQTASRLHAAWRKLKPIRIEDGRPVAGGSENESRPAE